MMIRRRLLAAFGVCVLGAPLRVFGQQQPEKARHIGVLLGGTAASTHHLVKAFVNGMAEFGYQEGRNVRYEVRYRTESKETIEQLACELVTPKVHLIWALGSGLSGGCGGTERNGVTSDCLRSRRRRSKCGVGP